MATQTQAQATDRDGNQISVGDSVDLIGGNGFDCGVVYAIRREIETDTWIVSWRPGHAQAMPRATEAYHLLVRPSTAGA